jgi:hypothetical protein
VDEFQAKPAKFQFFAKQIFSRQKSLLQNTKEKFGGKKIYFAKERDILD